MNTLAPGCSIVASPGPKVTMGVPAGTVTASFSPLATRVRVRPSDPVDSASMVALVMVLSGTKSQG